MSWLERKVLFLRCRSLFDLNGRFVCVFLVGDGCFGNGLVFIHSWLIIGDFRTKRLCDMTFFIAG